MYPIYLPDKHLYTQKLVHHEHLRTLHGGVELTMTSVRSHVRSCALHLDLVSSLETQEFILSLKMFIARKGRPDKIYFGNGSTFVGAAGWLRKTVRDEKFSQFLAQNEIVWQFNLSRAPWWGGQFERMIGLECAQQSHRVWSSFMAIVGRSTT